MRPARFSRSSVPIAFLLILTASVGTRALRCHQPIVENYVGRQIPTAMVARNLARTGDFLHPTLDTGPFPNLFLVEPPVYQAVVAGLAVLSGGRLELASAGRIVSALASGLAVWGLWGLVRRRDGNCIALAAAVAFTVFPITIRYGRSFQPDMLMLGALMAGANCMDLATREYDRRRVVAGWCLLTLSLAAKVIIGFTLIPIGWIVLGRRNPTRMVILLSAFIPAISWYLWANYLIGSGPGSRASAENRDIWLNSVGLGALTRTETYGFISRFLLLRAFSPLGFVLSVFGLWRWHGIEDPSAGHVPRSFHDEGRPRHGSGATYELGIQAVMVRASQPTRQSLASLAGSYDLWRVWFVANMVSMALLAGKLHHEYYWLGLSPAVAVGLARCWFALSRKHPIVAGLMCLAFFTSAIYLVRGTWETPREWLGIVRAAAQVRETIPPGSLMIAPEALLFYSDRKGCRLELNQHAARRAASEWGGGTTLSGPLDLVKFYRRQGAEYFADVSPASGDGARQALHELIRSNYLVIVDDEDVQIADLTRPVRAAHGNPGSPHQRP